MHSSVVFLSIISAIFITAEILIYKHIGRVYPGTNGDMVMWMYRMGSMLFISIFIFWELFKHDIDDLSIGDLRSTYYRKALATLEIKNVIWWIILMSICSAAGVVAFYRAVNGAHNPGLPTSIRSIYIPLTFFMGTLLMTKDWGQVHVATYIGVSLIVVAIGFIIYGSAQGPNPIKTHP